MRRICARFRVYWHDDLYQIFHIRFTHSSGVGGCCVGARDERRVVVRGGERAGGRDSTRGASTRVTRWAILEGKIWMELLKMQTWLEEKTLIVQTRLEAIHVFKIPAMVWLGRENNYARKYLFTDFEKIFFLIPTMHNYWLDFCIYLETNGTALWLEAVTAKLLTERNMKPLLPQWSCVYVHIILYNNIMWTSIHKATCLCNDLYQRLYVMRLARGRHYVGYYSIHAYHFAGGTTHWRWRRGVGRGRGTHTCGEIIMVTTFLFLGPCTIHKYCNVSWEGSANEWSWHHIHF